jgi:hypothetical protein
MMEKNCMRWLCFACLTIVALPSHAVAKGEWYVNWEMEDRIAHSQLILVARVSNVSAMTVVHGGKASSTLREYRFQPVRRLKGVFSREELPLTSSDLGISESDGSTVPPLQQGEFRLLLLMRTAEGFSCVSGAGGSLPLDQQVPKLIGPDDPIVAMTQVLVEVTEEPSRNKRAALLIARLADTSGPPTVPLLRSLGRRAIWAAQNPSTAAPLARLTQDKSPAVRATALEAINRVLAADYLRRDEKSLARYANALRRDAESNESETPARVAALRAAGRLGEFGRTQPWTARLLLKQLDSAPTHAERQAATAGLADLQDPATLEHVLRVLDALPLDEETARERNLAQSVSRLAADGASAALVRRMRRSLAAGESPIVEIEQLGLLKSKDSIPGLLEAAGIAPSPMVAANEAVAAGPVVLDESAKGGRSLSRVVHDRSIESAHVTAEEQIALANAFEQIKDERAVEVLGVWLRSPATRWSKRSMPSTPIPPRRPSGCGSRRSPTCPSSCGWRESWGGTASRMAIRLPSSTSPIPE